MRLQKFIALAGLASRRKAEDLITQGRVRVNGKISKVLGVKVNPEDDIILLDEKKITIIKEKIYIMINKPLNYISSSSDQFNRATVIDLIKDDIKERIYPVGRLDYDTEGLLILTNDGEVTYKLTHPKHKINKIYIAKVEGIPNQKALQGFIKGLRIDNYITSPAKVKLIKSYKNESILQIGIYEGRNRQVRKMCDKIGHPVLTLKRIGIGELYLGNLPVGKWRYLNLDEIKWIKED